MKKITLVFVLFSLSLTAQNERKDGETWVEFRDPYSTTPAYMKRGVVVDTLKKPTQTDGYVHPSEKVWTKGQVTTLESHYVSDRLKQDYNWGIGEKMQIETNQKSDTLIVDLKFELYQIIKLQDLREGKKTIVFKTMPANKIIFETPYSIINKQGEVIQKGIKTIYIGGMSKITFSNKDNLDGNEGLNCRFWEVVLN